MTIGVDTAGQDAHEAGDVLRPLGPSERWLWIMDQLSPMNAAVWVHVRGMVRPEQLARAAEVVVAEHPLLRVGVETKSDGTDPWYRPVEAPRIPIRTLEVPAEDAHTVEAEVDTVELHEPIDWRRAPLARIVDVARGRGTADESHDLILTVAHLVTDGMAAMTLLQRLVEHAARSGGPGGPPGTAVRPRRPLPAPEDLVPRRDRSIARAKAVARVDRAITSLSNTRSLEPETAVAPRERRTRFTKRELSGDQLGDFLARCRREGVTVHGALMAATALAVGQEISPCESGKVSIISAINLRPDLVPRVDNEELGSYASGVVAHVASGPTTDLWTTARQALRELNTRLRFRQHLAAFTALDFMAPPSVEQSGPLIDLIDYKISRGISVSDIGRLSIPDRIGEWEISGVQGAGGISCLGCMRSIVTISHGVLHWNFCFIEGLMSLERADRIANGALAALRSHVESAPFAEVVTT